MAFMKMKKFTTIYNILALCMGVAVLQACNQKNNEAKTYELLDSIVGTSASYNSKSNCYYVSFYESDSLRVYSVIDVKFFGYKRIVVQQASNEEYAQLSSEQMFDALMQIASYLNADLTEAQFINDSHSPFIQIIHFKKQDTIIMLYKSRNKLPWKVSDVNLKDDWYMHTFTEN